MHFRQTTTTSPSVLAAFFFLYSYLVQARTRVPVPVVMYSYYPQSLWFCLVQYYKGGISFMVALFSSFVQFFGLLGVFKYIMDQASVNAVHQMLAVLHEISKNGGPASLTDVDRQKLITEVGNKVWDRVVGPPTTDPSALIWIVRKTVPEGVRHVLGYATYPIMLAYNKIIGKGKAQEISVQERTRQIAIQGMWSFLLPTCLAMIAAGVLVWEVEFVQVASKHDYYSNEPKQASRIVKRIMLGGGKLSFSVPYTPLIMITAQLLVGTVVFQLVSLLTVVIAHQPGNNPPMSPR